MEHTWCEEDQVLPATRARMCELLEQQDHRALRSICDRWKHASVHIRNRWHEQLRQEEADAEKRQAQERFLKMEVNTALFGPRSQCCRHRISLLRGCPCQSFPRPPLTGIRKPMAARPSACFWRIAWLKAANSVRVAKSLESVVCP